MGKVTLHTQDGIEFDIDRDRVIVHGPNGHVVLPWEYNPRKMRPWLVTNEYGRLGVVWATCEQDALDELVDAELGNALLVEDTYAEEHDRENPGYELPRLGNAGEPAQLDNVQIQVVRLDPEKDCRLLCDFAECRGAGFDTLEK